MRFGETHFDKPALFALLIAMDFEFDIGGTEFHVTADKRFAALLFGEEKDAIDCKRRGDRGRAISAGDFPPAA